MNENYEILKEIETENFILVVFLFIIGLAFLANYFETHYYKTGDDKSKKKYRELMIFVFSVTFLINIYYFYESYKDIKNLKPTDTSEKIKFDELNLIASALIIVAGAILLYIAICDKNLNTEIAFS